MPHKLCNSTWGKYAKSLLKLRLQGRPQIQICADAPIQGQFDGHALGAITGFKQVPFEITKLPSHHRTNYSVHARAKMTVDYLTAFSSDLLYYIFYCGLGVFLLSFTWLAALVLMRVFGGHSLEGWLSLIVSIWMFGGLTIVLIGLIGIYVAHIFNETKGRPYVIVREVISSQRAPIGSIGDPNASEPVTIGRSHLVDRQT